MLRELTEKLLAKESLDFDQANGAVNAILDGKCPEVAIAGFLTALAAKGETAQEVAGMAKALRDHAVPVRPKAKPLVDTCGTGGDGQSTFNISTTAAIVAAGAGVAIAKHGNRAITSKCGSADILAQLGVKIDATPAVIERCIDEANIGFMFAPNHHPAMKYVQPIRKTLGYRTAFNILGPLANPACADAQIIGVAKPQLMDVMVQALKLLGVARAMVVHGQGMDEFTICGTTDVMELRDGQIRQYTINHNDFGIAGAPVEDLTSHTMEDNLAITRGILQGKITGPQRDVVVFNAAAAIMIGDKAADLKEGITAADESINSGQAQQALEKLVKISNS